jgi:hypothetical protein
MTIDGKRIRVVCAMLAASSAAAGYPTVSALTFQSIICGGSTECPYILSPNWLNFVLIPL